MSASLLAELSAIEVMMMKRAQKRESEHARGMVLQKQLADSPTEAVANVTQLPAQGSPMDEDTEVDREHTCAICLVHSLPQ